MPFVMGQMAFGMPIGIDCRFFCDPKAGHYGVGPNMHGACAWCRHSLRLWSTSERSRCWSSHATTRAFCLRSSAPQRPTSFSSLGVLRPAQHVHRGRQADHASGGQGTQLVSLYTCRISCMNMLVVCFNQSQISLLHPVMVCMWLFATD